MVEQPESYEVRWQCPGCRRFLSGSAVHFEGYRGWSDCGKCGRLEQPWCVPIKAKPIAIQEG